MCKIKLGNWNITVYGEAALSNNYFRYYALTEVYKVAPIDGSNAKKINRLFVDQKKNIRTGILLQLNFQKKNKREVHGRRCKKKKK